MREYSFKRGFEASEKRLVKALESGFDSFERSGSGYRGRIEDAEFVVELRGKKLVVETINPGKGSTEVLKRYKQFLELLTGYSAKERRKKMLKETNSSHP